MKTADAQRTRILDFRNVGRPQGDPRPQVLDARYFQEHWAIAENGQGPEDPEGHEFDLVADRSSTLGVSTGYITDGATPDAVGLLIADAERRVLLVLGPHDAGGGAEGFGLVEALLPQSMGWATGYEERVPQFDRERRAVIRSRGWDLMRNVLDVAWPLGARSSTTSLAAQWRRLVRLAPVGPVVFPETEAGLEFSPVARRYLLDGPVAFDVDEKVLDAWASAAPAERVPSFADFSEQMTSVRHVLPAGHLPGEEYLEWARCGLPTVWSGAVRAAGHSPRVVRALHGLLPSPSRLDDVGPGTRGQFDLAHALLKISPQRARLLAAVEIDAISSEAADATDEVLRVMAALAGRDESTDI